MKKKIVFDIECYSNYFLIMFKNPASGKTRSWEMFNGSQPDRSQLRRFISRYTLVGFNSLNYDCLMLRAFIGGYSNQRLKGLSDHIITSGDPHWMTERKFELPHIEFDHIDIKEPSPGVGVGLKLYGGRMGTKRLQDLPIPPDAMIKESDLPLMHRYCENDLDLTAELLDAISQQIELRETVGEKYGLDLRSKSDAQMAEAIIRQYLEAEGVAVVKRRTSVKPFKYRVPEWVRFETETMQAALGRVKSCTFTVSDAGKPQMPKELGSFIEFGGAKYKFGIGGLHSNEKSQVVIPEPHQDYSEEDVGSLYPTIILEQGCYPEHLGPKFLKVYKSIYDERMAAKHSGNKLVSDTYKILLNGSYGKFGSVYSYLYSPELMIQTTITGQLSLLMLIEKFTLAGMSIKSANTDGINILRDKSQKADADAITLEWELATGYRLERTEYLATYSRDVNNYVAVKPNGSVKGKGAFGSGGLMKNPQSPICVDAVHDYLKDSKSVCETIRQCDDPHKFCTVRTVNGGAVKDGELLGRVVRWYYAKGEQGAIHYQKNGNKVPKSDGAKPLMDLPDTVPSDIDYEWYIIEAKEMLKTMGVNHA